MHGTPYRIILITATIAVLICGCNSVERQVMLRYKFDSGLKMTYDQATKRSFKVTEGDSVITRGNTEIAIRIEQTVRRVLPDSTAEIQERDSWDYVVPAEKDSSVVDTVRGKRELVIFIKPNGKVIDIEFSPEIDSATAAYIEDFYQQGAPVFPDQLVKVGTKWTQSSDVVIDSQPTQASTSFELTGFGDRLGYECAAVSYKGNLIIPVKEISSDTARRSGVDHIELTGVMHFALAEGQLIEQTERWVVDGERQKLRAGKMIKYRVSLDMSSTVTLKERKKV